MMKNLIIKCLSVDSSVNDKLMIVLMLPVLSVATTLYSALFCILFAALLVSFNICISILFNKFKVDINMLAVFVLLNGAVSIAVSTIAEPLIADSFKVCFVAMIYSLYFIIIYGKSDKMSFVRNMCKPFVFSAAFIIMLSIIREFLSSGAVLKGFTENGFVLFPHKFGDYVNTTSALFLILAVATFIFVLIFGERKFINFEKGTAKVIFLSLAISLVPTLIAFAFDKLFVLVNLPMLSLLVPFALVAVGVYLLNLFCDIHNFELIAILSLVFSVYVYLKSEAFIELLLVFAAVFVSAMLSAIWAELLYNSKKHKLTTTSILLVCSLVALVYEKLI